MIKTHTKIHIVPRTHESIIKDNHTLISANHKSSGEMLISAKIVPEPKCSSHHTDNLIIPGWGCGHDKQSCDPETHILY